ncbi:MAG: YraN family protein [Cyanobacteriota bacterium]|nr:YraN family protein [Cyanobacteriota bacterium]
MPEPRSSSSTDKNQSTNTGILGEDLVAQWLEGEGWQILARRWRCRWGELDIVALENLPQSSSPMLAFVEVKTRRRRNWDEDGLLSITESKQEKLSLAASVFLSDRPHLADYPCRFDVALVRCSARPTKMANDLATPSIVKLGHPVAIWDYQFVLQEYIKSAFNSY